MLQLLDKMDPHPLYTQSREVSTREEEKKGRKGERNGVEKEGRMRKKRKDK